MNISIITPSYNSEKYIRQTIESIKNQSFKNYEHIVVDGLSIDKTVSIVQEYKSIKLLSEKDNGQSDAINKGFRMATGDILAWQNADDLYLPTTFQTVVDYFENHPSVDVIYGDYTLIDENSKWICEVRPPQWDLWLFAHARFVPMQPTVFWRRRVYDKIGKLNETLHYCMDVDFFSRAAHQFQFAKIPKLLGAFRVHNNSKTQQKINKNKINHENKIVLSRNFNYGHLDYFLFYFFIKRQIISSFFKKNIVRK